MRSLPLLLSLAIAALIASRVLTAFVEAGLTHENYRGRALAFPGGAVILAAAALALVPLSALQELTDANVFRPEVGLCVTYVLGVSFLGMLDDMLGAEPRGWRGHGRAILSGGISTGALKAAGSLGFALFALRGRSYTSGEYLLSVGVLVLATNLFNLLDLRPGRSAKGLVLLGIVLLIGTGDSHPLNSLGIFIGPILVLGLLDLRERTMLGDTGSNLIGAVAGLWMVLSLSQTWKAIAFVVLGVITVYGEFRSISDLIERAPLLRRLDSLGRLG